MSAPEGAHAVSEQWRKVLNEGHLGKNWLRSVLRRLPSAPRCKVCNNPFGGIGGKLCAAVGMSRSRKNPNVCALCCEHMPNGGAEVDAVIMFVDVRNSTEIAEKLGPTGYSKALNRFYSEVTDVLVRHDAIVDKLIGDEVMAFFVRGHAGRDFKRVAIDAARSIMRVSSSTSKTDLVLPIGIGMESGMAFAGNIGGRDVVDFTVVGDPVNMASRIQAAAEPGEILIGETLYSAVSTWYEPEASRLLSVKGKSSPLSIYAIGA